MALILETNEAEPAAWPAVAGLSDAAQALPLATIWRRIERYITRRWQERQTVWIVQGPGVFVPPLSPAAMDTAERWIGEAYSPDTPRRTPQGLILGAGTYRLTYTVGADTEPPDDVQTAAKRLAEYWAEVADGETRTFPGGATRISDGDFSISRPAAAVGGALFYSGAADLLRRYR